MTAAQVNTQAALPPTGGANAPAGEAQTATNPSTPSVGASNPVSNPSGTNNTDFGLAGNFEQLIMMAIGDMLETDNKQVSLASQLSQLLATADTNLMKQAYTALQNIYNTQIAPNTSSSDSGQLATGQSNYQVAQTKWQGLEQQAKTLLNSATSLVSQDNSNMNNFMQYTSVALQLAGYTSSMLQRQM